MMPLGCRGGTSFQLPLRPLLSLYSMIELFLSVYSENTGKNVKFECLPYKEPSL